jgi:flavin-dependent dehydrogenase
MMQEGRDAGSVHPRRDLSATADVLVVGGGPAGCATAIALARRGRRVTLLEKDRHPRFHIGESLLPMSMPLLAELGVLDQVEAIGVRKCGADFPSPLAAGYQVFRFERSLHPTWTHAVQIRRQDLDALLIKEARAEGVAVHEQVCVERVALTPDGVVASARAADGSAVTVGAAYLVDATGRATLLGNQLRLKRRYRKHQSAALYAHFTGILRRDGEDAGNISIYRVADGWVWVIPLPDGITSIGLVCGPDTLRGRAGDSEAFLMRTLRSIPTLAPRLAQPKLVGHLEATGNYSYACTELTGPRWIMVGDAGVFVDPIFSSGVHFALHGARAAAALVDQALRQPGSERAMQRNYVREQRSAVARVSWFIVRFNTPVMRRLFSNPRNTWRIEEAMISMLAGDLYRDEGIVWRLRVFKMIYWLHCLGDLGAGLRGFGQVWRRRRERFNADAVRSEDA